jgi:membrane associated rhomboid family serine protease
MSIHDRHYMIEPNKKKLEFSGTWVLLGINGLFFIVQHVFQLGWVQYQSPSSPWEDHLYPWGATSLDLIFQGHIETLFTYCFVHANIFHILFNCTSLYFFGPEIENTYGRKRFYSLYFIAAFFAAIAQLIQNYFLIGAHSSEKLIGASGSVYAIISCFVFLNPQVQLTWIAFILKAKNFLKIIITIELVLWSCQLLHINTGFFSNVSSIAHLTGILCGYWFYRKYNQSSNFKLPKPGFHSFKLPPKPEKPAPSHQGLNYDKLNAILDKQLQHGFSSLTSAEQKFLLDFSYQLQQEELNKK